MLRIKMASPSSMSVSIECVNVCKLQNGDVAGRFDCSMLSCASKAPRVLTGFLASTAHPPQPSGRIVRRNSIRRRCEVHNWGECCFYETSGLVKASTGHSICNKWKLYCSPSSYSSSEHCEVSPDSLWEDLKPSISYLSPKELDLVHKALNLAFEAHDGQRRRSGEPFIIHPVAVAQILGELELDWESIAAGLLHDTVEDTVVVTFESIEKEFGATVRHIVEGETKVSKLGKLKSKNENLSVQDVKADDLRQMFLAMTEEVRVIIVKLADRLHNMRTLAHMPPHKQSSIAMETLQVFAPLAKLLGIYQIKSELENLAFMYTNPEDNPKVKRRVAELYREHEKHLKEANQILMKRIEDDQFLDLLTVKTEVRPVCKEPYSIYKAVLKSKSSINEFNQIAQLRIIIKPKPCVGIGPLCNAQQICYHVLGLVHGIWSPIPRAMKDYIATPKPNGYQSLHTTVIPFLYESMFRLEVQIRTEEMDLIAERGIAAHYSGKVFVNGLVGHAMPSGRTSKGKAVCLNNANIALRISWLNAIREWQEEFVGNMSSREFVDTVTRDLLGSRVFVFTPRGEIKNLPKGATVIDYAYMIHTEIGNKMVAAKVNGNLVSPTHMLVNAEVVEIITYNGLSNKSVFQRHKQWLQYAKTRSARHKIMKFLREQAALSATEITADSVEEFIAESQEESKEEPVVNYSEGAKHTWQKLLRNVMQIAYSKASSEDIFQFDKGKIQVPTVNGKHNKNMQHVSLKAEGEVLSQGNGVAKMILANIPLYREVLLGLEVWQASKIMSWHNLEGNSIQWLSIVCIDRKGMMADVTSALAAAGITLCSCAAEIDRRKGMGVMLFQVEASMDDLTNTCSKVDLILGVLGWSTGCSWLSSSENCQILEC
ncbi:putative GTP diphosphokinase RSH1, chloroplastic isoform X2 [Salvia splendens]|uniref:putative GTP diphosphokinase RSH1, chloroplastic isoform X2 n=1 Tax=Salvia splendens TaxID=180675 RepID=UPI001C26B53E|nr:putative GTP diphosphokinase RSH1, chloroplastic isoform X2 [Salvia splendens]